MKKLILLGLFCVMLFPTPVHAVDECTPTGANDPECVLVRCGSFLTRCRKGRICQVDTVTNQSYCTNPVPQPITKYLARLFLANHQLRIDIHWLLQNPECE
jgi:hypothetical protein